MVPFITDLDVTETYTSELVYGSVAAGVSIVLIVCLVICFKHRKKARAGRYTCMTISSTSAAFLFLYLHTRTKICQIISSFAIEALGNFLFFSGPAGPSFMIYMYT